MTVSHGTALARWQTSLERLAELPPAITANLVNTRLLADVARVLDPGSVPVELRVVVLWAAEYSSARVADELARMLNGSVPGARPVLIVFSLPADAPPDMLREQLAGAHAVIAVTAYEELVSTQPDPRGAERIAAVVGWLARALDQPGPEHVTITVDGRTSRRSDQISRSDWIQQMVIGRLGMPRSWPAEGIVETGPPTAAPAALPGVGALAERVLRPFRNDLARAHTQATLRQVRHAVRYTKRRCTEIRAMTDLAADVNSVPPELRWTWLQAYAAGRLADTVVAALDAGARENP
jgi:hypothetical protein